MQQQQIQDRISAIMLALARSDEHTPRFTDQKVADQWKAQTAAIEHAGRVAAAELAALVLGSLASIAESLRVMADSQLKQPALFKVDGSQASQ